MTPFLFISGNRPPSEDRNHYNDEYEPERRTPRTLLHAGSQAGAAAGKTQAWGPPGENKLSLMEKS